VIFFLLFYRAFATDKQWLKKIPPSIMQARILSHIIKVLLKMNQCPKPITHQKSRMKYTIHSVDELYLMGLRLEQFYIPNYDPLAYYFAALK
jgi:hypothetical protein